MSSEVIITTPDENAEVSPHPETPGRYMVTKTTTVTTTVTTQTWIDVQVVEEDDRRFVVFGFNHGNNDVDEMERMIEAYGLPDVVRFFTDAGKGIVAWDHPILELLDEHCVLVYSFKDWPLPAGVFSNWMTTYPAGRFKAVWWCIDHEPEQGPESGDPNPATYAAQWTQALAIYNSHPRKAEFFPIAIFTEFYARKYWSAVDPKTGMTWYEAFGHVIEFHGMAGVGFDIYDSGYPNYRTPEHRNEIPLRVATRAGLPLLICELNIANKPDIDPDDTGAAAAYRANTAYLRDEVTHPVPYVMHFYKGGGSLWDRPEVQEAFQDALDENPE